MLEAAKNNIYLRKQSRARQPRKNDSIHRSKAISHVISGSLLSLLTGVVLLSVLSVMGELNEPFQRIGLALIIIPAIALGFSLNLASDSRS